MMEAFVITMIGLLVLEAGYLTGLEADKPRPPLSGGTQVVLFVIYLALAGWGLHALITAQP